jgi:hypothetical protein
MKSIAPLIIQVNTNLATPLQRKTLIQDTTTFNPELLFLTIQILLMKNKVKLEVENNMKKNKKYNPLNNIAKTIIVGMELQISHSKQKVGEILQLKEFKTIWDKISKTVQVSKQ